MATIAAKKKRPASAKAAREVHQKARTERENHARKGIADRLKEAREAKGLSQAQLAELVPTSRAAVGQWEIGHTSPSVATLAAVADILGVEASWLAYNVDPGAPVVRYREMDRDGIHEIKEVSFDGKGEIVEVNAWAMPEDYLNEIKSDPEDTVICTMNSDELTDQGYESGKRVIVNRADTRPSPGGVFAYFDGFGLAFAHMSVVPGKGAPKVRIGKDYEAKIDDLNIIGRVKARFHH